MYDQKLLKPTGLIAIFKFKDSNAKFWIAKKFAIQSSRNVGELRVFYSTVI